MRPSTKILLGAGATLCLTGGVWMALQKSPPPTNVSVPVTRPAESKTFESKTRLTPRSGAGESIVAGLEAEPDEIRRAEGLDQFIATVPISEIPKLLSALLSKGDSTFLRDVMVRLLSRWTEEDPRAAANWAAGTLVSDGQETFLGAVGTAWAGKNVDDAIAWGRGLNETQRSGVLLKIAYAMVGAVPMKALALARELPQSEARDELVGQGAANWAAQDPQAASQWAGQIEDKDFRERVISNIATAWSDSNPVLAASLAISLLAPGRVQEDAVVGIVQRWAQKEPNSTAKWVAQFGNTELGQRAVEETVRLWAVNDPEKAGAWVGELPPGGAREKGVAAYVNHLALDHPSRAVEWAQRVAGPESRDELVERLVTNWLQADKPAAAVWIEQSSLPKEDKERLLKAERP